MYIFDKIIFALHLLPTVKYIGYVHYEVVESVRLKAIIQLVKWSQ